MINSSDFKDIAPKPFNGTFTAQHVNVGLPLPKTSRLELFSPDEWEGFIDEWVSSLKEEYATVKRFSGAGDKSIDVAAFYDGSQFDNGWDNYQCKHYDHALYPTDVWVEIGKLIYFSFLGEYPAPKKYFFVAPKGTGTTLTKFLSDAAVLKAACKDNWDKCCRDNITATVSVPLDGDLLKHFESFNFSIFDSVSPVSLIEQHSTTPFHAVRFGGELPLRAGLAAPPAAVQSVESRYVQQLYGVYSEQENVALSSAESLKAYPDLDRDFLRQRERFYSAEALRNFARDNVPANTYEALETETLHGVIDTCETALKIDFTRNPNVGRYGFFPIVPTASR